jgi:archaellum component FlaC
MTMFSALVRRTAAEAEHRLRAGLDLLAAIVEDRERQAERERLAACDERVRRLERVIEGQDRDLRALRSELDSLVGQLNDRLLPRMDERMDDTERDLTSLATGLIRAGRESAGHRSRLETAENRITDLRGKLARMEQRAGLWRDLQATMARLGDDVDALRSRDSAPPAPTPLPAPAPISRSVAGTAGETGPQRLNGTDAHRAS